MKKLIPLAMVAALAVTSALSSCNGNRETGPEISNFDIHEVLKSASCNYSVAMEGDTFLLSVYTSVQWPLRFGDSNLEPLKEALLYRMYRVEEGLDVDKAITDFVNNRDIFGDKAVFTEIDNIDQDEPGKYEVVYTAKMMELTESTVSYQITAQSYLGGPHANYATYPFTYDLVNACVLTPQNLFKPGTEAKLLELLKNYLADQLGVRVSQLGQTNIFEDEMKVSQMVYLTNGGLIFHYNPYDIAPYSEGIIDIEVPSYELSDYLTPRADSLLNQ